MNNNIAKKQILTYRELIGIKPGNSPEQLVPADFFDQMIVMESWDQATNNILVRETVAKKLANINQKISPYRLKVQYGFRPMTVQQQLFDIEREKIKTSNPALSDAKVDELTHVYIAVPSVAGHPTGGAIDVTLVDNGGIDVDMGMKVADFQQATLMATYADGLTKTQKTNRQLLHDAMISENFAPFYGEWWHFSYGDKEWAAFYGLKKALYGSINNQFDTKKFSDKIRQDTSTMY